MHWPQEGAAKRLEKEIGGLQTCGLHGPRRFGQCTLAVLVVLVLEDWDGPKGRRIT